MLKRRFFCPKDFWQVVTSCATVERMIIASWNVNSLRVRLPHVLDWLDKNPVDVLALQETKVTDDAFPKEEITQAGYSVVFSGQKTYNGVALITREPAADVLADIPQLKDEQRRILIATVGDTRVMNVYVPNGESTDSDKYEYKLDWLKKITSHVKKELKSHKKFVLLGDFNIAPADDDVYKPERWKDKVLCSKPERAAYSKLLSAGLVDTFREFEQPEAVYSWWDYRFSGFKRNAGLRIDLILASEALAAVCENSDVDKIPRGLERPSDHAPVFAEFDT